MLPKSNIKESRMKQFGNHAAWNGPSAKNDERLATGMTFGRQATEPAKPQA